MRPQDLRIGNLVQGKSPERQEWESPVVVTIIYLELFTRDKVDFKPIPLTEEWLTKLGFKQQGSRKMWVKDRVCVVLEAYADLGGKPTPEAFYIGFKDLGNVLFHTTLKVEFVHELQNAFALTGEELTIKSE